MSFPSSPSSTAELASFARRLDRRRLRNANPYDASHRAPLPRSHPTTSSPEAAHGSRGPRGGHGQAHSGSNGGLARGPGRSSDVGELVQSEVETDAEQGEERIEDEEEDDGDEGDDGLGSGERDPAMEALEDGHMDLDQEMEQPFDTTGLKEIGNLASWTVSSFKPGCGVEALRDEDTNLFWQSDGPQPHSLSIHFSRLVSILYIRIYLDFEADESYTPTKITLLAGTGYHDLIPFRSLELTQPKGWTDVPLDGVGGRDPSERDRDNSSLLSSGGPTRGANGGDVLRAFLVQIRIVENHQNGKDTHVRGVRVYGRDERAGLLGRVVPSFDERGRARTEWNGSPTRGAKEEGSGRLMEPDWMGESELR